MLNKRDLNTPRTPMDVERRYNLKKIEPLEKEVQNKVDKVKGKNLSTNDFTNTYKKLVDDTVGLIGFNGVEEWEEE